MRRLAGDNGISRGVRTGEALCELGTERRSRRAREFACTSEGFDEFRDVHGRASALRGELPKLPGPQHALVRRMARRPNRQGCQPHRDRGTRLCPTIRRSSRPSIRRYHPAGPGGPYGSPNRCTSRFEATRRTTFTHHARAVVSCRICRSCGPRLIQERRLRITIVGRFEAFCRTRARLGTDVVPG